MRVSHDGHRGETFHYGIANPPFGRDWKSEYPTVRAEYDTSGPEGRFAPGLPGKDDGQTLFLLQLLSNRRLIATPSSPRRRHPATATSAVGTTSRSTSRRTPASIAMGLGRASARSVSQCA